MTGQPQTEDDGPPLTELESLQLKCNEITDESLVNIMNTLCNWGDYILTIP
jgi:hypothetical protein